MNEFMGVIKIFGGNFAPRGWMFCFGQSLQISTNQALFSLIGNVYGGDGKSTFCLPDLRSRVPVAPCSGLPTTQSYLGKMGGSEVQNVHVDNLPKHKHIVPKRPVAGTAFFQIGEGAATEVDAEGKTFGQITGPLKNGVSPLLFSSGPLFSENNSLIADTVDNSKLGVAATDTISSGSGAPFSIMQPYIVVNYIICVTGIFPIRD